MYKDYKQNQFLNIFLIITIISYVLGFYLNEDSAGGGKIDYLNHEWGTIQLFIKNDLSIALNSILYESSRTPLFYIVNKFVPFNNDIKHLRIFWFVFSSLIPVLMYYTLRTIFQKDFQKVLVIFFSCIILISPYFRSNAYWPSSENLQIFFVLSSLLFYLKLIHRTEKIKSDLFFLSSISIFFAYCAFYTDQKAFFLVALIYFDLVRRNDFMFFFIFSFLNILLFVPAIYLFISWGGLVPIESTNRIIKYAAGTNIFISTIGIYFVLIFISNIFNKNFIKRLKVKTIDILLIVILSIFSFFTLPMAPITFGSGIISKLLGIMTVYMNYDWNIIKYLYFLINLLFILIIFLLVQMTLMNLIIFLSFVIVYNLTSFSYQSYVDPIFYILVLTILDFKKDIVVFDQKTSYFFLSFYSLMLSGSIIMRSYII